MSLRHLVSVLRRIRPWLLAAAVLVAPAAAAENLLVEGAPPQRVVVSTRLDFDPSMPLDTAMARVVAGVIADLDGDGISRLRACLQDENDRGPWRRERPTCYLHLFGAGHRRVLEVLPGSRRLPLHEPGVMNTEGALPPACLDDLLADGPLFRGSMKAPTKTPRRIVLPPPYTPSHVAIDRPTMRRRLYRGMRVLNPPADRTLGADRMHVRIPSGYDPRSPAGLLVWASPVSSGEIPPHFDTALDDRGIIAVGVDGTGNDRDVQDKFQLMLDAVTTVSRRFHVDPRRVYIAGMSGGGKVASILAICFPEIFTGSMPIVGLATHHELARDWGEHRRGYFARPEGRTVRMAVSRPMAVISGPRDFNYREMRLRANLLRRDGFSLVQLYEHPEMGHELPPAGLFRQALEFVDGPWQLRRQIQVDTATARLQAYLRQRPEDPTPRTPGDRAALGEIMRTGAFTGAAWRAWDLLRETRDSHRFHHDEE